MRVTVCGKSVIDTGEKVYGAGDELDLSDKEAKKLIARGLVKKALPEKKVQASGGKE